jgi:hypothetical protein
LIEIGVRAQRAGWCGHHELLPARPKTSADAPGVRSLGQERVHRDQLSGNGQMDAVLPADTEALCTPMAGYLNAGRKGTA